MRHLRICCLCLAGSLVLFSACDITIFLPDDKPDGGVVDGATRNLGDGTATAYADLLPNGQPKAIGVRLSPAAFENLPTAPNDGRACYDKDEDGTVDPMLECVVGHEYILELPEGTSTPFQYVMLNWNPMGHVPPGVYDRPHFDVHFYIQDLHEVMAIDAGPCPVLTDCDDYATATQPVPEKYVAEGYVSVDAVEPMMGDHLLDPTGPEFNGEPFTYTWIFGRYGGKITFYEPMITRDFLLSKPNTCVPVPQPEAFEQAGYYPTEYCMKYHHSRDEYTVTLETFRYQEAG